MQRLGFGQGSARLGLGSGSARVCSPYLWFVLTIARPTRAGQRARGLNWPTMRHRVPIRNPAQYWARSLPVPRIWSTFKEPSVAVAPWHYPIAPPTLTTTFFVYPEFVGFNFRPATYEWPACSADEAVAATLQADPSVIVSAVQVGSARFYGALPGGIA